MKMRTLTKQFAALGLSLCFLFVTGGLAYTAPLDAHRGHHNHQTHGKTWCSWMCQAGQGIQAHSPDIPHSFSLVGFLIQRLPGIPAIFRIHSCSSRAPPWFLRLNLFLCAAGF
jgi:hypothetical protein